MYDFIIVGQGIAGSILSYNLLSHGKNILVIDKGNMESCSATAAGLFNPVTGKKMTKTWNAGKLFPFFHTFYKKMEMETDCSFFYPTTIYRPFGSIEEQNHWISKSTLEEEIFVKIEKEEDERLNEYICNDSGGFQTNYSGWVDVKEMMRGVKNLLTSKNFFYEEQFNFNDFSIDPNFIKWKDHKASNIIFCEGHHIKDNPYFNWIPLSPSKGEILTVRIQGFPIDTIINKNLFIVPIGQDLYKVGATFERTTERGITEKGKAEIMERLSNIIKVPFEVLDQTDGIRPSVPDRRPLIGRHPENPRIHVFNGLGTKGISLSPFYSEQFIHFLDNIGELDQEVNIERYYSLYFSL